MNTPIQLQSAEPIPVETGEWKPYPPSFVDRLMDAVKRLPIPYGLTYLLLFTLEVTLLHIISWVDGWLPVYTFSPIVLLYPLWLWGPLAIMTYLDSLSHEALSNFSPLLDIQSETLRRLKYEFTTMPAKSVIISSAIWSVIYIVSIYLALDTVIKFYGYGTLFSVVVFITGLVSYFIGSAIYYHTIRQLRLVNQTVKLVKQFDLFRLDPVYAFSVLTAQTGIAWVILTSLTLLIVPIQIALVPMLVTLLVQVVLALTAFALPLRVVNQRLVAEKRRLLAEHDERVRSTLARLHRCLDENELGEVAQLNNAITGLNAERGILDKIPTWPWRTGLLTGFLSIVVLPIILFLIQLVLSRWLGN